MSESDDSQMSHSLEMSDSDHSDQSDSFSDTSSLDNQSFSDQDSDTGLEPHASYQDQLLADSDYAFTTEIKEHDDTADLKELLVAVQNNSLSALKKLLVEFKQLDTQDHSQKAFNLIVFSTVKYTPLVADSVLFRNGARGLPASSPRWPKVQSLVKSYLTSVIKLMQEMTDVSMLRFIVKYMQQSCHYLASFPKLAKQFLKLLIDQWAHSSQDQVKVACFLTIRKLAMTCPEYLDPAIKSSQRALLSNAKDTNVHTWTSLSFMTQCIIELLGLSLPTAYQHMFVSLRQLAIMLRTATAAKVKDSYKAVYNWQCFFNLRLWGKLLCTWADPRIEPADAAILKPLVYPFVQIATGIMKLKPSSRYFPFRLQIIDLLSQVGRATHVFVPLPAYLLEVL